MRNSAKRTVAAFIIMCMLFGICAYAEPAVVSGSDINVRSGPGTGYAVIDCLAWGTNVDILDRSNSSWYKISFNGNTGYIYSSFLKITGSSSGTVNTGSTAGNYGSSAGGDAGYINAMYVNVRSGPSSDYPVVGTFNTGTAITINGESGSWYSITVNGSAGYVFKQYATKYSSASVTPPALTPAPELPVITPAPAVTPAPSVSGTAATGYVNGSGVNMRSGPASTYPVLACLDRNTELTITGSTVSGWTPVKWGNESGYIYSSYVTMTGYAPGPAVTPAPETQTPAVTPAPQPSVPEITPAPEPGSGDTTAYINGDGVSFRSGPGTNYTILATYDRGKQVIVKGSYGAWSSVIVDSYSGYVYSSYLSSVNPLAGGQTGGTAAPAVTPAPQTQAPVVTPAPEYNTGSTAGNTGSNSGYINASSVNMRSGPGSSYQVLACLDRGTQLTITSTANSYWYAVSVNGTSGYVYSQYVTANGGTGNTGSAPQVQSPAVTPAPEYNTGSTAGNTGFVTGNSVHFRSGPGSGYSILGTYNYGKELTVLDNSGVWTKVIVDGSTGYIYNAYVSSGTTAGGNTGSTGNTGTYTPSVGGASGQDIANFALQFVGSRYIWGGSSPDGFDCSGLVKYVYDHYGYNLKRVACDQATEGIPVDTSSMYNLQPGDILCFYSGSSYIGHVGIYIGGGQFVHASTSTTGVIISSLAGWYTERGYLARRIIY